jgi:transposase
MEGARDMIFVGNDWAEEHHDVCVMDESGKTLAIRQFDHGIDGVAMFHDLVAGFVSEPCDVVIGVETDRGMWVEALIAAGYLVYAMNPKTVSRYREGVTVSGAKSDKADAKVLADMVRINRHLHRLVAGDSDLGHEVKIVARTHQTLIWERQRTRNRLRAALLEYYPGALATFDDIADRDAVSVLVVAPTPALGAALTTAQIKKALRRGGRQRNIDTVAKRVKEGLGTDQLAASEGVTAGFGELTKSYAAMIATLNTEISRLAGKLSERFLEHPDAEIYLSMPGIGVILGARILGEFGDEPGRYSDAKAFRNYAATSPITRQSGNWRSVESRWIRNKRLADATLQAAGKAIQNSPGAAAFFEHQKAKGDPYNKAIRTVANKMIGQLYGCLTSGTLYDEETAWGHRQTKESMKAA